MVDRAMIDDLLAPKKRKAKEVKPNALIRMPGGGLEAVVLKSSEFGAFTGKTGSTKRGRKGRTYRAANGWNKYQPNWETEVVAYKP